MSLDAQRERCQRKLARGFVDVLRASEPDLSWQVYIEEPDSRRPLATGTGEALGLEAPLDHPEASPVPHPDHADEAA